LAASLLRHQNQRHLLRLLRRLQRHLLRLLRQLQRSLLKLLRQHISKIVDNQGIEEYTLSPDLLFGKKTGTIFYNPVMRIPRVGRPTLLFYEGIYA